MNKILFNLLMFSIGIFAGLNISMHTMLAAEPSSAQQGEDWQPDKLDTVVMAPDELKKYDGTCAAFTNNLLQFSFYGPCLHIEMSDNGEPLVAISRIPNGMDKVQAAELFLRSMRSLE